MFEDERRIERVDAVRRAARRVTWISWIHPAVKRQLAVATRGVLLVVTDGTGRGLG
jgi:hypothetical protein